MDHHAPFRDRDTLRATPAYIDFENRAQVFDFCIRKANDHSTPRVRMNLERSTAVFEVDAVLERIDALGPARALHRVNLDYGPTERRPERCVPTAKKQEGGRDGKARGHGP
jgi:hypothetical protein